MARSKECRAGDEEREVGEMVRYERDDNRDASRNQLLVVGEEGLVKLPLWVCRALPLIGYVLVVQPRLLWETNILPPSSVFHADELHVERTDALLGPEWLPKSSPIALRRLETGISKVISKKKPSRRVLPNQKKSSSNHS